MFREKSDGIAGADCFGCGHVAFVVAVMMESGADVVSSSAMYGPCASVVDSIVDHYFAAAGG